MILPVDFKRTYHNLDEEGVKRLAMHLADVISAPSTLCFYGDLGAGKSTFCRSFIQKFLNDPEHIVPSPTFTLVQDYFIDEKMIYHFDLYRLESSYDLVELNFEECLLKGICLIEWPERANHFLPQKRLDIFIQKEDDFLRCIKIIEN